MTEFRPERPHSTTIPSLTPQEASPLATSDSIVRLRRRSPESADDYGASQTAILTGRVNMLEKLVKELQQRIEALEKR